MQSQAVASARISSDPANGRVETALELRASGRVAEALELLSGPGDYAQDVYTLRGDLQLELGQLHEAVGSYSTVLALDPGNMYAHRNLAACLRRLKQWGAAEDVYRKILDHDSYSDAARVGLGECLLHLNQPEKALESFEACWSEGALLRALFGKAVALQTLRRFDASEALYLRFLELQPGAEEALANLIALSMETFDLTRVQRYAEQLAERHPQSVVAWQALTLVAVERRLYEDAADYYERLLNAAPEEMLFQSGNDNALEYRLSRKDIEAMYQVRREVS
jgi:tetratricopeptide (TPR) repeat protein